MRNRSGLREEPFHFRRSEIPTNLGRLVGLRLAQSPGHVSEFARIPERRASSTDSSPFFFIYLFYFIFFFNTIHSRLSAISLSSPQSCQRISHIFSKFHARPDTRGAPAIFRAVIHQIRDAIAHALRKESH